MSEQIQISTEALEILKIAQGYRLGKWMDGNIYESEGVFRMAKHVGDITVPVRELLQSGLLEFSNISLDTMPPLYPLYITDLGYSYLEAHQ